MNEVTACHIVYPGHHIPGDHIKVPGYDGKKQARGMAIVIHRA